MGRQKEFCVEQALGKALEVFWERGFEGASLSDLTDAMGITRPSLYATYGNKEELFRKALALYDACYMSFLPAALGEPTAVSVVEKILEGFVILATNSQHPRGCLGTNGALACSTAADPIKVELVRRRGLFEASLKKRLQRAQDDGDLPADASPADLARFVMAMTSGISVQAAGGASRSSLRRVADIALRGLPAKAPAEA